MSYGQKIAMPSDRAKILSEPAGERLDSWVHCAASFTADETGKVAWPSPKYSTDIEEAFFLLENELDEHGGCFSTWGGDEGRWMCRFGDKDRHEVIAETPMLAICRALVLFVIEEWPDYWED